MLIQQSKVINEVKLNDVVGNMDYLHLETTSQNESPNATHNWPQTTEQFGSFTGEFKKCLLNVTMFMCVTSWSSLSKKASLKLTKVWLLWF